MALESLNYPMRVMFDYADSHEKSYNVNWIKSLLSVKYELYDKNISKIMIVKLIKYYTMAIYFNFILRLALNKEYAKECNLGIVSR